MPIRHTDRAIDQMGSKAFARVAVSIVLVAGVGISLALFAATRAQDEARFQFAFTREGRQAISALKEGIDSHLDVLRALDAFHRSSEDITRQEFHTFASEYLRRGGGAQVVEWIPVVRQSEMETYEKNAQRQGVPHYQFTEQDKTGKLIRAGAREEYYPVYYAEPSEGTPLCTHKNNA